MGEETEAPTGQRQDLSLQAGGVEGQRPTGAEGRAVILQRGQQGASEDLEQLWLPRPALPPDGAPPLTFAPLAGQLPLASPDPGLRGSVLLGDAFLLLCAEHLSSPRVSCLY